MDHLKTARKLFESRSPRPHVPAPTTDGFEAKVDSTILDLMIVAREIGAELYSALPRDRASLFPKLDKKLRTWLQQVSPDILQTPIGHQSSYHFHSALHMMINATWLMIHRELAYVETEMMYKSPQIEASWDVIARSAIQIAKLYETFRRTDDARIFHGSGVQWISLAVEGLVRQLDRISIDQAIEPLAHLQSLQRTLKVLSASFSQAATLYASTASKSQALVRRMDGDEQPGRQSTLHFKVPALPRARLGSFSSRHTNFSEDSMSQLRGGAPENTANTAFMSDHPHESGFSTEWLSQFSGDMGMSDVEDVVLSFPA